MLSSASGATLFRIVYNWRRCGWPLSGTAWIYSAIVVGFLLVISASHLRQHVAAAYNVTRLFISTVGWTDKPTYRANAPNGLSLT